ncbi:MAG: hypothetical protein LBU23_13020 [Planctomycetota bacterium]|jgi:hypothetical protein|nr:hypothetical protein [Planctomycetota bacterium]
MVEPESLREFTAYHRQMAILMLGVCLGVDAALLLLLRPAHAWSAGFALGAGAQLAKFVWLDARTVLEIAGGGASPAKAQLKTMFISLLLFGLAAAAALGIGGDLWALAAGIFLPRLLLLADAWLRPNPFARPAAPAGGETPEGAPE